MKLHAEPTTGINIVTAYGPGFVDINRQRHLAPLWVVPSHDVTPWNVNTFEQLTYADFEPMLHVQPEIFLLGTGSVQRFLPPSIAAPLRQNGIGVESMSTAAACRTYNILANEGRKVIAALLF